MSQVVIADASAPAKAWVPSSGFHGMDLPLPHGFDEPA